MIRTLLVLGRVSNLPTVWTNCLAGWVLAGGASSIELIYLMAAGSLLYAGGMVLNDVCDAAWDEEHAKDRPIPAGKISRGAAAMVAGCCLAAGAGGILWIKPSAWPAIILLLGAIVLYDVVHKRWKGAVLMMGACRFLLYVLAGFVALTGESPGALPDALWIGAAGVFLFVVGITAAARGESTGGRVPAWAWFMLVAPLVAWFASWGGWGGSAFAMIFGGWLWRCERFLRGEDPARVGKFVSGLLAGIVLVDAMMASTVDWKAALVCLLIFPVTLLLQRYVPAT